jgi:hypothetical protein
MLQRLDRPELALGDAGDLLEGEVGNEAQRDHLALIVGQPRQGPDELRIERIDWKHRRDVGQLAVDDLGPPRPAPGVIDEAVPGNGEDPAPQIVTIAPKPREVARHLEEHLAEQVFGIAGALGPQIPQHRGGELAIGVLGIEPDVSLLGIPRPLLERTPALGPPPETSRSHSGCNNFGRRDDLHMTCWESHLLIDSFGATRTGVARGRTTRSNGPEHARRNEPLLVRGRLSQLVLHDFAGGVARELGHEPEMAGALVVGETLGAEREQGRVVE